MRPSRSTPNLKAKKSNSRSRIHRQNSNHSASVTTLSQHNQTKLNGLVLSSRNPDLPVTSLPGPPVPPRSYSQIHLDSMQQNTAERRNLRRSISESKVDKDRKNEERAVRARSVHFDGQISEQHDLTRNNGTTGMKQIS